MKKYLMLCNILFLLFCMTACSDGDVTDHVTNVLQSEDEHVLSVKNATNSNCPNKTYGEAFESYFESPTWKYYKGKEKGTDEDGDGKSDSEKDDVDIVEFTGYCMYQDVKVKALIQFTLDDDTFTATFLSFNDVPQNMFILVAVIEDAFTDGEDTSTAESSADAQSTMETSTEDNSTEESGDEDQTTKEDSATEAISEETKVDKKWYQTYNYFYSETGIFLEVSCHDDGSLDFIFDGITAFTYFGDDSFVEDGTIYYNCDDGTQIQYYVDAIPCIRVVGHDEYNGNYYLN